MTFIAILEHDPCFYCDSIWIHHDFRSLRARWRWKEVDLPNYWLVNFHCDRLLPRWLNIGDMSEDETLKYLRRARRVLSSSRNEQKAELFRSIAVSAKKMTMQVQMSQNSTFVCELLNEYARRAWIDLLRTSLSRMSRLLPNCHTSE